MLIQVESKDFASTEPRREIWSSRLLMSDLPPILVGLINGKRFISLQISSENLNCQTFLYIWSWTKSYISEKSHTNSDCYICHKIIERVMNFAKKIRHNIVLQQLVVMEWWSLESQTLHMLWIIWLVPIPSTFFSNWNWKWKHEEKISILYPSANSKKVHTKNANILIETRD